MVEELGKLTHLWRIQGEVIDGALSPVECIPLSLLKFLGMRLYLSGISRLNEHLNLLPRAVAEEMETVEEKEVLFKGPAALVLYFLRWNEGGGGGGDRVLGGASTKRRGQDRGASGVEKAIDRVVRRDNAATLVERTLADAHAGLFVKIRLGTDDVTHGVVHEASNYGTVMCENFSNVVNRLQGVDGGDGGVLRRDEGHGAGV